MSTLGSTWVVMLRDVSESVRVEGEPRLIACLVLDAGTGLVIGQAIQRNAREAFAHAFQIALTAPPEPLTPAPPARVLCGVGQVKQVSSALARLTKGTPLPAIVETDPVAEAEDIFDSLVGHLAGRRQPQEFPSPEDWQLLVDQALTYYRVQPWTRWSDAVDFALQVTIAGAATRYVAVVLGNEGVQRGLVLYPGSRLPPGLRDPERKGAVPVPPNTLMFFLDPPSEPPPEFRMKALRYGWPPAADLVPAWVNGGPDGGSDVSRRDVGHLTLAIAAVVAHDARGPLLVNRATDTTTGRLILPGDEQATYAITQRYSNGG